MSWNAGEVLCFLAPLNGRSPVPIVFISASILCHSSAVIRLEFLMLTDVAGAGGQRWRDKEVGVGGGGVGGGRGQAAESRGDIVFGHKTLNSDLSHFIPADRCLAGQNIHTRGGVGEEGEEPCRWRGWARGRSSGGGSKQVTPSLPRLHSPPSTDLETIDFIPAFAPEEGEAVSDYWWGLEGWR